MAVKVRRRTDVFMIVTPFDMRIMLCRSRQWVFIRQRRLARAEYGLARGV
jgi:hypothetical protein